MFLRLLIIFFLIIPGTFAASTSSIVMGNSASTSQSDASIFSVLKEVNKDKASVSEKESIIKYEKNNIEENNTKKEELETLMSQLEDMDDGIKTVKKFYTGATDITENKDYKDKVKSFETTLSEVVTIINPNSTETMTYTGYLSKRSEITRKVQQKQKELDKEIAESEKNIAEAQEELKTLNEEVKKSETAFQSQVRDLVIKFIIFVTSIILLVFVGRFLKKLIKSRSHLSEEKREVFLLIVRWVRNTTVIVITFVFFFSEFVSILPFLAILGTALGLALRDVIASFIAWFIIGLKDSIYKVGDVIEIEQSKIMGKVVKITPLTTIVQELGLSGPSGVYLSYPNKDIFSYSIKNYSRMNSWSYMTLDFFLDATSDIVKAKQNLYQAIIEVLSEEGVKPAMTQKAFFKKFGYTEKSLQPQVLFEAKPQGVMLRGKILTSWSERNDLKTKIIERFILSIKENPEIKLLTIWQDKV